MEEVAIKFARNFSIYLILGALIYPLIIVEAAQQPFKNNSNSSIIEISENIKGRTL